MASNSRVVLHEAHDAPNTLRQLAESSGVRTEEIYAQIAVLNARLRATLGYRTDPITVIGTGTVRVDRIAGLLRLNNRVELEVVPKFLDPRTDDWRADFFLLAILVTTGHLLVADAISAGLQDRGDLATLVAQALLRMHRQNERRPIRGYRRMTHAEFAVDGDVDWETVILPEPGGFRLERLELTSRNAYNAVLRGAANALIPEVGEGDVQAQLRRLSRQLGNQARPPRYYSPLPQRHQAWRQTYALSQLVLEGMGLDLRAGEFTGPGFVLSTWEAWQYLCEEVVRRALPGRRVLTQHPFVLGQRETTDVVTHPDISVLRGEEADFLMDAKYRIRFERKPMVGNADLYESLAFLRAAGTHDMILLYPAEQKSDDVPIGTLRAFDRIRVGDMTVKGVEMHVGGLSARGGFERLIAGVRESLISILAHG
ncbi:hypothetical protein [Mycobacterium sp. E2327]|uniref:5-methylcytosine restriction system specificity protein McrC n=1 Tax=Mycobacterium sp. E2327 TaxID=1834132 RepID=UPI0009EF361A|nr:hypothetical protein [Mycobacterium sp. E2327]